MEKLFSEKIVRWLLPTLLILFILVVITLPAVVSFSYADRSDSPDHVLSYSTAKLLWDQNTIVDSQGVAVLDLFAPQYNNVQSVDGRDVVAPGTEGSATIRLKNTVNRQIKYNAVLYRIRSNEDIIIDPALSVEGSKHSYDVSLPEGVEHAEIIDCVWGRVYAGQITDFDIYWQWPFEETLEQNVTDTALGIAAEPDSITVGLYIIVEDMGEDYAPATGDDSHIGAYSVLMVLSFCILLLLAWEWRRSGQEAEDKEPECQ